MQVTEGVESENVIDFQEAKLKLNTGGNPPSGGNWLQHLTNGTRFLAQHRNNSNSLLMEFFLGSDPKQMKPVFLGYEQPQGFGFHWHDPVRFCQEFSHFDTLQIEIKDGSIEVPTGTVEGNGKPEVLHSVHEEE